MTNEERRADDLRRRHRRDHGLDDGLPWRQLQAAEQALWRGRARAESANGTAAGTPPRRGFTPASTSQRTAVRERGSIVSGERPCDAAHLTPRALGGCDDPLCTVPLTRAEHRAFDDGQLDLLPYLIAHQLFAELAHMIEAHRVDPIAMLNRLTGQRWTSERPTNVSA